ncbi:MAG: ABC transporter ATP-binding protein [Candidatus Cloacimonetes bacterium]|nr:ABC transporter ATP-binding protein [Candidatus Cloacimonadota bacterium]
MKGLHKGLAKDDLKSKIYDKVLFRRLVAYLKPYKFLVFISFILLLLITGTNLLAPVISQRAVDEVIVSNKNLLEFTSEHNKTDFIKKYSRIKFKEYDFNDKYYLIFPNKKINFIPKTEIKELKESGKLLRKITVLQNKLEIQQILSTTEFVEISEDQLVVQNADLIELRENNDLTKEQLKLLRREDINKLKLYGLLFFGVVSLQLLFTYFQIYFVNYAAQYAMYDLRRDLFFRLERMPLSFFDKNPIGRLVTRITNDIGTLNEMLGDGLIQLIQEFFVLVGIMIAMLIYDWKLALVTFSILPFTIVFFIIFIKRSRFIYRNVRKKLANINATLSEDISGFKIIQLFNQYKRKVQEFSEINFEYYKASRSMLKLFAVFRPLINSTRRISVAILLWYGGAQILQDRISLGVFMAFLWYLDRFFEPIHHLSEKFNIMQAAMSGAERIFDLMDKDIEDYRLEKSCGKKEGSLKGEIEFRNVWLRYNDNGDVLKDISFRVKPGEKVALVGHTGSGKTSIISLLSGLYPFQKGQIFIDGKEINKYCLKDLRRNIGIVQQDVFLFSGTIRDNIVLCNDSISNEEMEKVAKYVNVNKFIESKPGKYLEPVMERGATFSVGQRQLIAFARVLAYDPAIFVLDEATSNIDTETEILIQDALQKLMQNRTSIIIAHRLSTIQHVDRIIVLHKGEIKEEGSHQELLANEGLYYDLYRLQYT